MMNRSPSTTPTTFPSFVDSLQDGGRYVFRKEEAREALGLSEAAFRVAAHRLVGKGRIASPKRGFFVIVPLEYRSSGAPPPPWYIDDLMAYLGVPYYVGLLSAAEIHGAAHQRPQEFQVVVDRPLRPILVGRARLHFYVKRKMERALVTTVKTETGSMRVSTPEMTAVDLVRYVQSVGHLGNVATILEELVEKIDPGRLVEVAKTDVEVPNVQRLGYLIEMIGEDQVAAPLHGWLKKLHPRFVRLRPDRPTGDAPQDQRWKIIVNETVEVDE